MGFRFFLSLLSRFGWPDLWSLTFHCSHRPNLLQWFSLLLVDLEDYILKHPSSYDANPCIFAGIKGTNELKARVNDFYLQHRKASRNATILFKDYATKPTITQQVLLKDGNLYLFVDGVMKNKTSRNKKKIAISEGWNNHCSLCIFPIQTKHS